MAYMLTPCEDAHTLLQITIDNTGPIRTMQIEGFAAAPCGGTHLNDLGEMTQITVRSIRKKQGEYKIGYDVA